jgi:ABC-type nitrate/sulfonate/bicarbonate transport system permease component
MATLISRLNRPVINPRLVAMAVEWVCYAGAMVVMIVAIRRVGQVATTETDVLLGVMLGACLGLLLTILGMVSRIYSRVCGAERPAGGAGDAPAS